jgi:Spx/MgsR family transcriptional regulator
MIMPTLYGIPNCDTVKKARKWLDAQGIAYNFHDYRKAGVAEAALADWVDALGWEVLLNRRGTTFRKLADDDKADLDAGKALRLMIAHPSTIKRPVVTSGEGAPLVGFDEAAWTARLG